MRRSSSRFLWAVVLGAALPAGLFAQAPACPYRAATPYNATVMTRIVPNAALNHLNQTLCCEIPNQNLDPFVPQGCGCGHHGGGCDSGCGNSCGAIFSRPDFGCGHADWSRWGGNSCGCNTGCGGCNTGCGSPCSTGCGAPSNAVPAAPAALPAAKPVKQVDFIEQVGFFHKEAQSPVYSCTSCPPNGPLPKHTSRPVMSMGCANCSTWESEAVFLFGSCRQFFGEPTHQWMHGK